MKNLAIVLLVGFTILGSTANAANRTSAKATSNETQEGFTVCCGCDYEAPGQPIVLNQFTFIVTKSTFTQAANACIEGEALNDYYRCGPVAMSVCNGSGSSGVH